MGRDGRALNCPKCHKPMKRGAVVDVRWKAHFHDEDELRALAKQSKWAVEPAPGKGAR